MVLAKYESQQFNTVTVKYKEMTGWHGYTSNAVILHLFNNNHRKQLVYEELLQLSKELNL